MLRNIPAVHNFSRKNASDLRPSETEPSTSLLAKREGKKKRRKEGEEEEEEAEGGGERKEERRKRKRIGIFDFVQKVRGEGGGIVVGVWKCDLREK